MSKRLEIVSSFYNEVDEDTRLGRNRHGQMEYITTMHYINQFQGSARYLQNAVGWLMEQVGADGLWDWGPQTKDPWGYFGYFSCNRHYQHNRVVDGSMEILKFLKKYIDNNQED